MIIDGSILIEIMIGVGGLGGSIFGLIRYQIKESSKREKVILEHHASREEKMLEYFTQKNGHMERIASDFSEVTRGSTIAIGELTTEIKLLNSK